MSRYLSPNEKLKSLMNMTKREGRCLVYAGSLKGGRGYSRVRWKGRLYLGHRLMFELVKGSIPKGKMICHTCDNRACIEPKHLYAGTAYDNAWDCVNRGRHFAAKKAYCKRGHELTKENTIRRKLRPRHRQCRECKKIDNASRPTTRAGRKALTEGRAKLAGITKEMK